MIGLLIVLIIAALILWAVRMLLPVLGLPEPIGTVIYVVIVVIVVLWLIQSLAGGPWPILRVR
jgi:hypothetical protein